MLYFKIRVCALLAACMLSLPVLADTAMTFTGNLVAPPCTVNDNAPLTVAFGDVEAAKLTEVNTAYYKKQILINVKCPGQNSWGDRTMTFSSTAVHDATQGVLQTSKYSEGLVIYLFQNDMETPISLNVPTAQHANIDGILGFFAGIGRTGSIDDLKPGLFTGSASLVVRYQ